MIKWYETPPPQDIFIRGKDSKTGIEFDGFFDGKRFYRNINSIEELKTEFNLTHWCYKDKKFK